MALTDGEDSGAMVREDFEERRRLRQPGDDYLQDIRSEPVEKVVPALQANAVTFYAISFSDHLTTKHRKEEASRVLQVLTKATGGLAVNGDAADLDAEFALIRNDIASQYVLGVIPGPSPPGRFHKLEIKVALKDAKVRHRLAYETPTAR